MKKLSKFINEQNGSNKSVEFPYYCDVIKISPNKYDGVIEFLTIDDIQDEDKKISSEVFKLDPWESIIIDEDIYIMIIDMDALKEK